ncbi:MAG: AsmA family protein, partial [Chitinophagales bacterium]|nr:AsmA family protein [Chitinophagales bacterium]
MAVQLKRIVVTVSKIFLWIILSLVLLLVAVIIAIQIPAVQNFITQKAVHFISDKTNTKVTLGHINIGFPKSIVLKDLFLEDMKHDTLLYSHRLSVDIDMFKILSHKIEFNQIEIEQLTAHIIRSMPDSSFNFDFLMNAFGAGDTSAKPEPDTLKSAWKIAIKGIDLKKVHFTFVDETAGRTMQFSIGGFNTQFKDFDLDEKRLYIKNIDVDHTTASIVQTKSAVTSDTASGAILYDIDVKDINLSVLNVLFQTPEQRLNLQVDKAGVSANKIDLQRQQVSFKKFNLSNSSIDFT